MSGCLFIQDGDVTIFQQVMPTPSHPSWPSRLSMVTECISRFGTMFFTDAVAAFANIGRRLRLRHARDLLDRLDATTAESARHRLRATLDAHDTGSGVLFDSRPGSSPPASPESAQ